MVGIGINLTSVIFLAIAQSQGERCVTLLETAFLNRVGITFPLPGKIRQGPERAGQFTAFLRQAICHLRRNRRLVIAEYQVLGLKHAQPLGQNFC